MTEETKGDYLNRIAGDYANLHGHTHAPWITVKSSFIDGYLAAEKHFKDQRYASTVDAVPADPEIAPRHWDVHALDTVMKRLSQLGKVVDRIAAQAEANMNMLEAVHGAVSGDKSHPIGEEWLNEDPERDPFADVISRAMHDLATGGVAITRVNMNTGEVERVDPEHFYKSPEPEPLTMADIVERCRKPSTFTVGATGPHFNGVDVVRDLGRMVTGLDVANAPDEVALAVHESNKWGIIPHPEGAGRLMHVHEFQGRLYAAYENGVYVLDGTELKPLRFVAE